MAISCWLLKFFHISHSFSLALVFFSISISQLKLPSQMMIPRWYEKLIGSRATDAAEFEWKISKSLSRCLCFIQISDMMFLFSISQREGHYEKWMQRWVLLGLMYRMSQHLWHPHKSSCRWTRSNRANWDLARLAEMRHRNHFCVFSHAADKRRRRELFVYS